MPIWSVMKEGSRRLSGQNCGAAIDPRHRHHGPDS
jgi:hypothetical protein